MPKATKMYQCQFCQSKFKKPSTLTTHIYTHTGEKPFECDYLYCNSRFSVLSNLRRHMKIHTKSTISKGRSISPQERLYCVQQLVLRTQQEQEGYEERAKYKFLLPKYAP